MGDDTSVAGGRDHRFPAHPVDPQAAGRAVGAAGGADQRVLRGGAAQQGGGEQEFPQIRHQVGQPVAVVAGARATQPAQDPQGGCLGAVQPGHPGGVRGPQQLGLRNSARGRHPGGEHGRGGGPQFGRGGHLGSGERHGLLIGPRGSAGLAARLPRRALRRAVALGSGHRLRVGDRARAQDGGPVKTPGREQAAAHRLVRVRDRAGGAWRERDLGVLSAPHPPQGAVGHHRHGRVRLDRGVQLLAQPGGQCLDG